jgi:hypothetical protein
LKANIEASRNTFEKVAREWHEINAAQWAKVHAADVLRSFERDVFPEIGSLPISALMPPNAPNGMAIKAINLRSVTSLDLDPLELDFVDGANMATGARAAAEESFN